MKKVFCRTPHYPPHSYGDCVRACLATLSGVENLPHDFDGSNTEAVWDNFRNALKKEGFSLLLFSLEGDYDIFDFMNTNNHGFKYMLLGSNAGGDHAVVCENDKIIHDPSQIIADNFKPNSCGLWIVGIVGRIS